MKKRVFVLWSGGLDSTYLIIKNIEDGKEVDAGHAQIVGNGNDKVELEAVETLAKLLKEDYHDYFNYMGLIVKYEFRGGFNNNIHLRQAPVWINTALYNSQNYSEIQFGYVLNDDAISYLAEIRRAYNGYRGLADDLPPLTFPLSKTSKETALFRTPERYLPYISFCEMPVGNAACGVCHSCKRMLKTITDVKEMYAKDTSSYFRFNDHRQLQLNFDSPLLKKSGELTLDEKDN
jgi:hypothetical protein